MAGRLWWPAIVLVVLGFGLSTSSMVQAQDPTSSATRQKKDPFEIYAQAGASPEQVAQIKELVDQFSEAQSSRVKAFMALMNDMQTLSLQPDPDSSAVMSKQDEINKSGNDMANSKLKLMLKIRAVLTPEQKQKLVELIQPPPPGQKMAK